MHLIDLFNTFFGWCPQVRTLWRSPTVLNNESATNAPSQGNGIPERTEWQKRYRNQVLLLAVFLTFVSMPFVMYFQTTDLTRLLFSIGIMAGLVVFAFFGQWLWNSLEMIEKGMVIKTGQGEYILLFLIAGIIPLSIVLFIAALTAILSYAGVWAFPAFVTGFAFIPWYVFLLILWWERRTGCVLVYDKKARLFSAVGCHEHAQ